MKLELLFFGQIILLVGLFVGLLFAAAGVALVTFASTAALDQGFWIDRTSWALPAAMTWDFGRWGDGAAYWQLTVQVLCFYWRAGSV